jgi:hypothetical protein
MRERWLNFENKQPEKAIVGSACNPKIVSIEITVWLLFAGITMSLSGCIVTYRDFPFVNPLPRPYETTAPPRCRQTVQFPGGMEAGWPYHWTYEDDWSRLRVDRALQGALQHYAGCSSSHPVVYNSTWVETEVVVRVLEKPYPRYRGGGHWLVLLIPVYSGQGGWELSYSFYDRNALRKTYKYEITSKQLIWLLLLPFSWINFFTYSLEEAVRSTTAQFVLDAQRDGYLGTTD